MPSFLCTKFRTFLIPPPPPAFATPCIRGIDFVDLRPTLLCEFHERLLVQSLVQDIRCAPPRRAINGSPDYEPAGPITPSRFCEEALCQPPPPPPVALTIALAAAL